MIARTLRETVAGRRSAIRLRTGRSSLMLLQPAAEKVAHVEPVLLMKRTIEVELLLEGLLDLRSDLRIELSPRIRTPWSECNDEEEMMLMRKSRTTLIRRRRRDEGQHGGRKTRLISAAGRRIRAGKTSPCSSPSLPLVISTGAYRSNRPAVGATDTIAVFPHHRCSFRHIEEQIGLIAVDRALKKACQLDDLLATIFFADVDEQLCQLWDCCI